MSHVVIETTVPVVVTSDDAHEPPVVVNAVQTTTVFVESEPEVIEVNAGPRGLPGPKGDKGDKGDAGDVPEAPLDGAAYARQSGAWVQALAASARGAAGGVASLDANGKLPESQLPALAITDTYAVADEASMLALAAQRGDIAVRSDINKTFALHTEPATVLANWLELRTPTDAVLSVAGKTGAVSLVPADVTGLDTALAGKADDSVALTDAAGTTTLPATAAAPVASRLQVLRNNVKQILADLAGKMSTTGGAFSNGISFGSAVAASPSTVTRHIELHGTGYGFSITPARLNYVVDPTATHRFMVGSTEVGSISSAGDLVMASNVTAYSDPRLKENFQRVQDPFYILSRLDGGTFNWRHDIPHIAPKAGKRDYGVLADQVKAVMPEIVTPSVEIDGEVYDTVSYEKLVPVLIEAVKTLHARVLELESKGD